MTVENTLQNAKFKIGDLVEYVYYTMDSQFPRLGIVVNLIKMDFQIPEEPNFMEYFYEYEVLWVGDAHPVLVFEMFIEKYHNHCE